MRSVARGIGMGSSSYDKQGATLRLTFACAIAAVVAAFSPNAALLVAGVVIVPVVFMLLWRPGEPQVLLFAVLFQWLQVYMPVLNASRRGEPIGLSSGIPQMETAAWLALTVILVLAVGMRLGAGRRSLRDDQELDGCVPVLSLKALMVAYGLAFMIAWIATRAIEFAPALRQPLAALETLRWVIVFILGWAALRDTKFHILALGVVAVELVIGFTGYFSGFKTILFLGIVLVLSAPARSGLRLNLIVLLLATLALSSFWQAVKADYRTFLNRGTFAQVVEQPLMDRFEFLLAKAADVRLEDLLAGLESGFDRLGYLEFFALTLGHVPERVPHQGGRLWTEAVLHVVTPRALFPDKPTINDSERTKEFTGTRISDADVGTSISIGYAAESYIDFGPVGMFAPIVLLGYFWGWAYHWLATRTRHRLLGLAVATNLILSGALLFESSNIKLFGGAVTATLVLWLVLKFGGELIWKALTPRASATVRFGK